MTTPLASRSALSERRWALRVTIGFTLASLLLHVPGLVRPLFNSDEASLATMAMVIQKGGTLYHQTADRKPPVVPYLYALVFDVTGHRDIRPVRAVSALALAATALLLALEARRRGRNRFLAVAGGLLFLGVTAANFPADSQAAGFELFMLLPMTAAVYLAGRGDAVAAGITLAVACLCKQTAIVAALPVALLLYRSAGIRPLVRAGLAAVAVIVATALFFGPRDFLLWTVTGNGGYLAVRVSFHESFVRGVGMTAAFVALNAGAIWCGVVALRRRPVDADLWLWLAGSGLAVLVGFRFFGHYYLHLAPPLALIAAAGLPESLRSLRRVAAVAAVPVVGMWLFSFSPPNDRGIIPYRDVADAVRSATQPSDRIFVWGEYPEIYWASNREPATRFIHNGFLTGNSPAMDPHMVRASDALPGAWSLLAADMAKTPPALIVDTSTTSLRQSEYFPLETTPLWGEVVRDYQLIGVVDGVRLYRRAK